MYNNVGRELKNWAKVIVIVLTIPSVILGIFLFMAIAVESEELITGLLVGLFVAGMGYLLARLSAIILYAFGELVETNTATARSAEKMVKLMEGTVGNTAKTVNAGGAVKNAPSDAKRTGGWTGEPVFETYD